MRRVRMTHGVMGAVLFGVMATGCSGSGDARSAETTTASPPASASASAATQSSGGGQGPWRAWTKDLSGSEGVQVCGATAHQVVCATGADGFVGRSRTDGGITWTVPTTTSGKNLGLVVDKAAERAVTSGGRTLRAANLRTGKAAWSHPLPVDRVYTQFVTAEGIVYALDAWSSFDREPSVALGAYRESDGKTLWHRTVDAKRSESPAAFGGRVYTTDSSKVTARDARTGDALATTTSGTKCPHLIAGGGYLVCSGSAYTAEDTFPPLRRLDPGDLRPLATAKATDEKPERALISADGVLMLFEVSPEDSSVGDWNAYDLNHPKKLWSYSTTTDQAGLVGGRFLTFTPRNDRAVRGHMISIDLHAGPHAKGAAAPRMSPAYPETVGSAYPAFVLPGGDPDYVVIETMVHHILRSLPLP
ncbi:PQQ-binding-like beta-propeller repeat protein [Streptomyces sp. N50]|uniref:outer membrane protein assembly factor BamB family protein n=1 Tax=Streptomyces sp. N50 TaxID=3081765 RepID=UPI0029624E17|nr:PQQ-binding-like beta-propeller repeat protein [Streptomyces sp. N50]WOX14904.1 PQQ-binding-like beta-propeller repeat protein [Streptomyces sp. N50]